MREPKIKTIDVNALEWFDKVNGNSYFAAKITINYGMKSEKTIKLPFQYGYGDQYMHEAKKVIFPNEDNSLWRICNENKIILRYSKREGCKQRELKNI